MQESKYCVCHAKIKYCSNLDISQVYLESPLIRLIADNSKSTRRLQLYIRIVTVIRPLDAESNRRTFYNLIGRVIEIVSTLESVQRVYTKFVYAPMEYQFTRAFA